MTMRIPESNSDSAAGTRIFGYCDALCCLRFQHAVDRRSLMRCDGVTTCRVGGFSQPEPVTGTSRWCPIGQDRQPPYGGLC
jgi:hypothetical protein